jgi:hypothetical protein
MYSFKRRVSKAVPALLFIAGIVLLAACNFPLRPEDRQGTLTVILSGGDSADTGEFRSVLSNSVISTLYYVVTVTGPAAYYFRTDETSFSDPDMDDQSKSPLLGVEIYGDLIWTPFSDVSLILGGGLFLPQTDKVFNGGADIKYRISLDAALSF